ncbi:MAG: response regulator transcription factor [Bacteroidetes bacterium]|nr:response regulator transcription factor [Bacteroidota bacterium]
MKTVIIEDEPLASERLKLLLHQYGQSISIAAVLESVEEATEWFSENPLPDLIFSDIQLSDGPAFKVFQKMRITVPVIFTTAYDQYALDAFKLLSIDYLLKPVSYDALRSAIEKLKKLHTPPVTLPDDFSEVLNIFRKQLPQYKSRFTGKIGNRLFFIDTKNIHLFYAESKVVYLVSSENIKYIVEYTLEQLEELLDPSSFFRINRSMIVHIYAINQVRPYDNNRLQIVLNGNNKTAELIVSRKRVLDFRKWANN